MRPCNPSEALAHLPLLRTCWHTGTRTSPPTHAHTAAQRWRCFRSYDISPSPSSIWVRTWKSGAAHPLFLSTESTSHCSVWGLWCCCGAFTHLEPVPPVREPISGSVRPTLPLESQQERTRGRRKGGVYDWGNERRRDAGDPQKVERQWCYTNTGEDWTSWDALTFLWICPNDVIQISWWWLVSRAFDCFVVVASWWSFFLAGYEWNVGRSPIMTLIFEGWGMWRPLVFSPLPGNTRAV